MVLICQNVNCKYRTSSGFCNQEMIPLNQFGACGHWWTRDGQFRQSMWDYADEIAEPKAATEQELPHEEKIEENNKTEQEAVASNSDGEKERKDEKND